MLNKWRWLMVGGLALTLTGAALACPGGQDGGDNRFDPCPVPGDFALPMPAGLKLVFREVKVPGRAFWGDSRRIVQTGDPRGGPFQGQRKSMVGGAFLSAGSNDWNYYLGKYEVSKAQFAAVLGRGDLARGIQRLIELSGDPDDKKLASLTGDDLNRALAWPVAWVSWFAIQEFINTYNLWCLNDFACKQVVPMLKAEDEKEGAPGFVRLPTETEWEYAARGGLTAVDAGRFDEELPVSRTDLPKYGFVQPEAKSKTRRIGSLEPTEGGFYDLFGNVQELTAEWFQADMGQGKSGALTARGGSIYNTKDNIRSAYRSEIPLYQSKGEKMEEGRNPSTGFRLVLVAPVLPTQKYISQLEKDYETYVNSLRGQTPVGETAVNSAVQAGSTMADLVKNLSALTGMAPTTDPQQVLQQFKALKAGLEKTTTELKNTVVKLDLGNQQICDGYVKHAIIFSNLLVRSYRDRVQKLKLSEALSRNQNLSAQDQQTIARLQAAASHEEKQMAFYFKKYTDEMARLAECGDRLAQRSLENFRAEIGRGNVSTAEQESFSLFAEQWSRFHGRRAIAPEWREQIIKAFEDKKLLMQL
ncbi:MAG: formylglycine-generating enzyme family protein [Candidatus Contendobacter sp.]|nr:formylglycine-generating enzyme family protein [Candidatus Contendobacter sp.]MDS4058163.1 formylglycine-generating enzyme family protein [Candidatus Contendobacter sp.]